MKRTDPNSRPVYSTDRGAIPPEKPPSPGGDAPLAPGSTVKLRLEKSGRAGKTVTVLLGLEAGIEALKELARELKDRCGSGGSVKPGRDGGLTIEIQGDHAERIEACLSAKGYRVRRAGG